ncbi:hypothetical protein ZWY2020_045438 [Hordeum vulgare]|nr:hypothetical protein ZWY2020_045438 [Hordeum vulgare]
MATENYDPCYPDQPAVHRYLPVWARMPAFAAKPAFVWADDDAATGAMSYTALTYSELNAAVDRMASGLLGTLRRGDTVLVLASPGLRLVKLLFACQRAGLTAVPVIPPDPSRPGPAHAHLLRAVSQTRPRAAVADARYVTAVASSRLAAALIGLRWLSVDELDEGDANTLSSAMAGHAGCGAGDAYLVQYTSGATGVPKPVVVTAGSAAHNVRAARRAYDLGPGSTIVSWLPQYHDCGLMFLLLTVVSGATSVLASPDAFLRRPRLWLELISEFKATCTPVPSFTLPLVLRRGGGRSASAHGLQRTVQLGSLRNLILINEPIYKTCVDEFVAEFGRHGLRAESVSPSYGLAENCTFVSTAWRSIGGRVERLPSYNKLLPSARLPSSMTHEASEIEIVVVDEKTGEPVRDGTEGEVWVSSPSNASGYLGHPSASHEAFCGRVPGRAGSLFVRTGDRGVVTGPERYLYVIGRSVDVIVTELDGRVHAHYIETAALRSAPDSLRGGCIAAFTAPATASSKEQMCVVAELQKGSRSDDHTSLCDGIRRSVWEEERVRVGRVMLVQSGAVPKTTSGKVRRGAAREKLVARRYPVVFEALYDDDGVSEIPTPAVGDEDGQMEERCAASWMAGEGGVPAMATTLGRPSRRIRVQSFL